MASAKIIPFPVKPQTREYKIYFCSPWFRWVVFVRHTQRRFEDYKRTGLVNGYHVNIDYSKIEPLIIAANL